MKWKKLEHNGILFPPDFETKKIKIKIKGESVDLDIKQEEMIYQWAKKKDTPYAQDKIFQKNFVADFAKTFGSKYKKLELGDIPISRITVIRIAAHYDSSCGDLPAFYPFLDY